MSRLPRSRAATALTAIAMIGLGTLTACGGGDYCGEAKSFSGVMGSATGSSDDIKAQLPALKKLADSAPDDVKADWKLFYSTMRDLSEGKADPAAVAKLEPAGKRIQQSLADTCHIAVQQSTK